MLLEVFVLAQMLYNIFTLGIQELVEAFMDEDLPDMETPIE